VRWLVALGVLGLVSCGVPEGAVRIKQYHLRAVGDDPAGVAPLRAERRKRLHGAISEAEQRERLGHYYAVRWDGPPGREREAVRLVFDYRQAATGDEVRRLEIERPGTGEGVAEFRVTGPAYLRGGRVLAWRLRFFRGGELVETHRSYLWE